MDVAIFMEQPTVARNMELYGGSFAKNLGKALLHADFENAAKIKKSWPELWDTYLKWGN